MCRFSSAQIKRRRSFRVLDTPDYALCGRLSSRVLLRADGIDRNGRRGETSQRTGRVFQPDLRFSRTRSLMRDFYDSC